MLQGNNVLSESVNTFNSVPGLVVQAGIERSGYAGADPGFLERGFLCIKVLGVPFAYFILFFLNIPWK